jgi:hypothetical protein
MKRKLDQDGPYPWKWAEGNVSPKEEHIELRYGNALKSEWKFWTSIARIGPPVEHVFPVQWLLRPTKSPKNSTMIKETVKELNFYFIELRKPDPWEYAIYHCGTMANVYSRVHWSYFPKGATGKTLTSRIIKS